jgi:hypothetical protein
MQRPTTLAWLTCAVLAMHGTAHAQRGDRDPPAAEITAFGGTGPAGTPSAGAAVRWPVADRLGLEVETEVGRAQLAALSLALGVVYDLPSIGRVVPYVAAAVSLRPYTKASFRPGGGVLVGTDTGIFLDAGGGVRVPVTDRWGVRSDARWRHRAGSADPSQWRVYNGATFGVGSTTK